MARTSKIFYLVFFSFAAIFIATLHMRPYPFVYLVKAMPIYSLAVLAFLNIAGLRGKLIGWGLVLSGAARKEIETMDTSSSERAFASVWERMKIWLKEFF